MAALWDNLLNFFPTKCKSINQKILFRLVGPHTKHFLPWFLFLHTPHHRKIDQDFQRHPIIVGSRLSVCVYPTLLVLFDFFFLFQYFFFQEHNIFIQAINWIKYCLWPLPLKIPSYPTPCFFSCSFSDGSTQCHTSRASILHLGPRSLFLDFLFLLPTASSLILKPPLSPLPRPLPQPPPTS